jgi:hypothetical protein
MSTSRKCFRQVHACWIVSGLLATASPAAADVVTDWNAKTVTYVNAGARPAPAWILDFAVIHIAIHDAVQAFQHRFKSYNAPIINGGFSNGASGSPVAAVAAAAHDVLVNRFPAQAAAIDADYLNYLTANGLAVNDPGVAVGQQAALNIILRRANDGAYPATPEVFTGSTAIGQWRPTPPALLPMSAPWMGGVTPFALKDDGRLLSEPPPPHLTSGRYAKDYNEVKAMGARVGSARTAEQTDIAHFYSGNYFAMMNGTLRGIALAHLTDIGDSARLFALANMAAADALISAWDIKRSTNTWRPSTAIIHGDDDGNHRTAGDPAWLPLFNDPPYPDYTSGANSITAAFMFTLVRFFGDGAFPFDITTTVATAIQKTRTYQKFTDLTEDVVNARIFMGIHFRFADEVARRQGKQAANKAFAHALRPLK